LVAAVWSDDLRRGVLVTGCAKARSRSKHYPLAKTQKSQMTRSGLGNQAAVARVLVYDSPLVQGRMHNNGPANGTYHYSAYSCSVRFLGVGDRMTAKFNCKTQCLVFMVLLLSTTLQAHPRINQQLDSNLRSIIAEVRSEKSASARWDAGGRLTAMTFKARPGSVTDATVSDLINLLDDPDDGVRLCVAAALGNLKAKAAVPKLLSLLPTVDCLEGTLTSARVIRYALKKMRVKPPPVPSYDDCHKP